MNKCLEKINLINQTIQSVLQVINNYVLDCENEKLKKLCTKIISDYEIIIDECKIIAKNYKKELTDLSFFEKYSNLIAIKLANINKKNTFEISKNIYLAICEIMPNLYHSLLDECDENEIIKRLINLNEEYINKLKSFFVLNEA